jgi:hypothetical protein
MTNLAASAAPDSLGDWPTLLWVGIALIAAAAVIAVVWSVIEDLHPFPTSAASAPATHATPTRAHCAVALCDDEPTVHIYASDEFWSFCVEHGTPYLTEDLAS